MIESVLLGLIRLYQFIISPLMAPSCRFYPTCSHYAYEAIRLYGGFRGSCMALWRLLRCHPFHPGGYEPVVPPARLDDSH